MIEVARRFHGEGTVHYTGIDLFEQRSGDHPGMTLKRAFCHLRPITDHLRLIPGDPWSALSRYANLLTAIDMVVISADQCQTTMDHAWLYLPRMLHKGTGVFLEHTEGKARKFAAMSNDEVQAFADRALRLHRRAA